MNLLKTDLHLGKTDWLLLFVSVAGITASSMFLFNDKLLTSLIGNESAHNLYKMGVVSESVKDVRTKHTASLTWNNLAVDDEVYEGDSIFTGNKSRAIVNLSDDLVLELEPNSLLVVRKQQDEFEIDLKVGQIVAKTRKETNSQAKPKKIAIIQQGKKAKVDLSKKATVQLTKSKSGELQFLAKKGETKIEIDGKQQKLKESEKAKVDKALELKKLRNELNLVSPTMDSIYFVSGNDKQRFVWKFKKNMFKSFEFYIDDNEKFRSRSTFKTDNGAVMMNLASFEDEEVFWKVKAVSLKGDVIETLPIEFYVAESDAPDNLMPQDEIRVKANEPAEVSFTWDPVEYANVYNIQVSKSEDFSELVINKSVKSNSLLTKVIIGSYYWRVRAGRSENGSFTAFSDVENFEIIFEAEKPVVPDLPDVPEQNLATTPEIEPEITQQKLRVLDESRLEKVDVTLIFNTSRNINSNNVYDNLINPPLLSWKADEEASQFKLQIATDNDFKNIIVDTDVKQKSYIWRQPKLGTFFYRVAAFRGDESEEDIKLNWSDEEEIIVSSKAPLILAKSEYKLVFKVLKNYKKEKFALPVSWSEVPLADYYKVQVNGKVQEKLYKRNRAKIFLESDEENELSVAVSDANGKLLSDFSEVKTATIKKRLYLAKPKLEFPEDNVNIVSFGGEESAPMQENIFSWSKVKYAEKYELEISQDNNFNNVTYKRTVDTNVYNTDKALKRGKYFWRVRGVRDKFKSKWSKPNQLEL